MQMCRKPVSLLKRGKNLADNFRLRPQLENRRVSRRAGLSLPYNMFRYFPALLVAPLMHQLAGGLSFAVVAFDTV
jgi:hypothetical protein